MHSRRPDDRLRACRAADRPAGAPRYGAFLLAALLTAALPARSGAAPSAAGPAPGTAANLATVTIEAAREKRELMRHVSRFVFSVMVGYSFDSLPRWDEPVCPLVAGLPRAQGNYVLARITQVAAAAHAPLAGEHCTANLFVVATPYPHRFLAKWWDRAPLMYNDCSGFGGIEKFLHSRRPIRVWYNTVPVTGNGGRKPPIDLDAPAIGLSMGGMSGCIASTPTLGLSQVYIVIDMRQINGLSIGQLADYVALIGLAQIQLDTRPAGPSILTLFEHAKPAPRGLSAWDRALLYALYDTSQDIGPDDLLQVERIRESMVSQILSSGRKR